MTDEPSRTGAVSDDEVRRARYGELPRPIAPEDLVELVDTDPPREIREPTEPRREWG